MEKQYFFKDIQRYLILIIATMVLGKLSGGFAMLAVPVLVVVAITRDKPIELLFWSVFMLFFSMSNRNLFSNNVVAILIVRVTLLIMAAMLAGKLVATNKREAKLVTPMWGIMAYIFWECAVSYQGWQPVVSYLKLLLFFIIYMGLICMVNKVNLSMRMNAKILRGALLAIASVILIGSVVLTPFGGLVTLGGEEAMKLMQSGSGTSLYMGMTCHPQVLGPLGAMLGTFLFGDLVFSIKKWDKLYIALILSCFFIIFKASSRTGMGALIAGCGFVGLMAMRAKGIGVKWKARLMSTLTMISVVFGIAVIAVPSMRNSVAKFVVKYGGDSAKVTTEEVLKSRQGKIDEQMYFIKQKPICGNGFQVSENMLYEKRTTLMSYLSAPVEKGTWILAVAEEGGIVGLVIFVCWLLVAFPLLAKRHAYIGASVFFALIVSNLGEFSMFSMTYTGGFFWALIFVAIVFDVQRMKGTQMQVFEVPIEQVVAEEGLDAWTRRLG